MTPSLTRSELGSTTCANAAFVPDAAKRSCGTAHWTLTNADGRTFRLCTNCAAAAAHKLGVRCPMNPTGARS